MIYNQPIPPPARMFFALKKVKKKILKGPGTDFESHIKSFFAKEWLQKNGLNL